MSKQPTFIGLLPRLSLAALAAMALTASTASAQSPLGSAQSFAVLGATTVTNTGASIITGNAGVSPGTALTGFLPPPANVVAGPGTVTAGLGLVNGTIYAGGAIAAAAHGAAGVAYAQLDELACPPSNNLSGQVLGTAVASLGPGVYCFDSSAQLTGTLHLTGAGPWVFQIGSTLTTASAASVVMDDAGQSCSGANVYWLVGSSATLGTATQFVGNVLAVASITATFGVSVSGSVMALAGAVTLDTNMIAVCSDGFVPPDDDKCEEHHDHHGDDDGDDDGDHHDGDHHDGDHHDNDHHDGDHHDGDHHDNDHHDKDKDKHDKDKDKGHDKPKDKKHS
ncbi:MAG: ice-binding family protein [Vicinamibacterales bacterium]